MKTMARDKTNAKVIHGDNLRLSLKSNDRTVEIVGDGCRLKVTENTGKIRMIGDGSRMEIIGSNEGKIEYIGDGGSIIMGPDVSLENVLYIGDGGRVGRTLKLMKNYGTIQKTTGIGLCKTSKLKQSIYSPE